MIFELAGDGAFDCPVTGIVDARGHFIDKQLTLILKKFESEDPDIFQGFKNAAGGALRGTLDVGVEARRGGD